MWTNPGGKVPSNPRVLTTSDLFRKFCETSTIHGTFFWSESSSYLAKLFWIIVVISGLVGSAWIIDNQFKESIFF